MKLPPLTRPLLGVDCHLHTTGLALWAPPYSGMRPTVTGLVKVPNRLVKDAALHAAARAAFQWTRDHIQGLAPGVAVIEDPFIPVKKRVTGTKSRIVTTRDTLRAASYTEGGWGFLLAAYGWELVSVQPGTWKAFFGATGSRIARAAKVNWTAVSVDLVPETATQDETDAAMIALWWRMTLGDTSRGAQAAQPARKVDHDEARQDEAQRDRDAGPGGAP